jgi:hypothetical protein
MNHAIDLPDAVEVKQCVETALSHLLAIEGLYYSVNDVDFRSSWSPALDKSITTIRIEILTNNRALILGQAMGFPLDGLRGYHPHYVVGYLHGFLEGRGGSYIGSRCQIVLDVLETEGSKSEVYRYITRDQAMREGKLSGTSALSRALEKYAIEYVLMAGSVLSGPSYGLIRAIELVTRNHRIESMVDMFAGSCSLSKVARVRGVSRVLCVDKNINLAVAGANLGSLQTGCEFYLDDAASADISQSFDLLVMDPFYEFALDAIIDIVSKHRNRVGCIVINLGSPGETFWSARLIQALNALGLPPRVRQFGLEQIAFCDSGWVIGDTR